MEYYKQLLADFERFGPRPDVSDKELWDAKYGNNIRDCVVFLIFFP